MTQPRPQPERGSYVSYSGLCFLFLLCVAALVMIVNARTQELGIDELLGYYTIIQPSVAAVLHFQLTLPVVIEPPAFDLLVHASWKVFGSSALALRLPSIVCMLLLMASVYWLLERLAGMRAAIVAMLLLFFFPVFNYGWQERPYIFMLAMIAAGALSWYCATHAEGPRAVSIAGLFLALALAINGHFFSIFATVPFLLAEAVRSLHRRRFDWPVVAALLLACATFAFTLPFRSAALPYMNHTVTGVVNWMQIVRTYQWTLNFNSTLSHTHHGFGIYAAVLVGFAAIGSGWRLLPEGESATWTLMVSLLLLPLLTVAVAVLVLHAYYPRYGIAYNVGLLLALGVVLGPWLDRLPRAGFVVLAVGFGVVCGMHQLHLTRQIETDKRNFLAKLPAPAAAIERLQAQPQMLIFAPIEACLDELYYGDPLVKQRLRCVYSTERELRYGGTVQLALTSQALSSQTDFQVIPYEEMMAAPGERIVVDLPATWDAWFMAALRSENVMLTPLGKGVTGDVFAMSQHP